MVKLIAPGDINYDTGQAAIAAARIGRSGQMKSSLGPECPLSRAAGSPTQGYSIIANAKNYIFIPATTSVYAGTAAVF